MKKVVLTLILGIAVTFLSTSCKKSYTCVCKAQGVVNNVNITSKYTYTFEAKKDDAESTCDGKAKYDISTCSIK